MAKKTYTNSQGERRHMTKWQNLVSKHGVVGAKSKYSGYKQRPSSPTTTGNVRSTKVGTRRVNDNKVGSGRRSILYYKGDKVGTWTKSGGNKTKGRSGQSWYLERGYGTAKKPVPDTKLTRRLGIANKGKETSNAEGMLVPGAIDGLNTQEDWEMQRAKRKQIREAQGYDDKLDESLGMTKREMKMRQSMKDRRDESKGMEKAMGRRAYQRVGTMDAEGLPVQNVEDGISEEMFGDVGEGNNFGQMRAEGLPVQNVEDGISEEMFGDVGEGNDFGQMRAETFNAPTKFSEAAKRKGYKAKGGKLYHKGDLVGRRDSKGNLTRKGVNTGRAWYMERGFGTARKPVPNTELTRKLGIAGAGRQMRTPLGLFGRIKRMLTGSPSGINQQQPWEFNRPRNLMIREAQGYDDKLDESMGMSRKEMGMKQSMKDRRDESKGMEKAMGRRAYQRVGTMDAEMIAMRSNPSIITTLAVAGVGVLVGMKLRGK